MSICYLYMKCIPVGQANLDGADQKCCLSLHFFYPNTPSENNPAPLSTAYEPMSRDSFHISLGRWPRVQF